jgi:adenine-specific DNA-methyltransferase
VIVQAEAREFLASQPTDSIDLVMGSPPYPDKTKRYGAEIAPMNSRQWVEFMLGVTVQACRACRGDVLWVVNGSVVDGRYVPAVERLTCQVEDIGLICERPCIWHKNAPPNRKDWFGNDWEYVLAFHKPGAVRTWDWEAIAHPPKFKSGGQFRQRTANGTRRMGGTYPKTKLARPRDVIRVTVGGGQMGHKLASENEAPYPERLVESFLPALSPHGGLVCDPFCGSGTTAAVARRHGRRFIGCDLRQSQVELATRRLADQFKEGS